MRSRKHGEPAGDVLFADGEGLSREERERIEDSAPGDLVFLGRVVEMACADRVFGQDQ